MNTNVKNICEVVEDIKETLADYQYKTIMDNLMVLNNKKEEEDYVSGADLDEVNSEIDEETDIEELIRHIHILEAYIPTIVNERTKEMFIEHLETLKNLLSLRGI
jgi:hypothetical protein